MAVYLFVYGTLKRGPHAMSAELWSVAEFAGKATVEGSLYRLGNFSGLVDEPGSRVHGEVARLSSPDELLARLDHYEGPEYERVLRTAVLESGEEVQAMLYRYAGDLKSGVRIESGKWE